MIHRWHYLVASFCMLAAMSVITALAQAASNDGSTVASSDAVLSDLGRQHRWSDAAAAATQKLSVSPDDTTALYWLGRARLQLQEFIPSEQAFRAAEKLGLNTSVLHEGLALAYYKLNQFALFQNEMELAAHIDPTDAVPYYYRGLYQLTIRSDLPQALRYFDRAIQLQPQDWKSLYEEGNCYEKLARFTEARQFYSRSAEAVEIGRQDYGWPYQGLARLALDSDPKQAVEFARMAVRLQPEEYSNHLVLARAYNSLGDGADALKEAREAVSRNPSDAPSRYLLFLMYRQSGATEEARKELEAFQTLNAVYGTE